LGFSAGWLGFFGGGFKVFKVIKDVKYLKSSLGSKKHQKSFAKKPKEQNIKRKVD